MITVIKNKFLSLLVCLALAAGLISSRVQAATYTVINTNNSGAGSLRQAVTNANANAGADTINFNISGAGVQTIVLTSTLPDLIDAITVDGTTQPGFASEPLIELNGTSAGFGVNGFTVTQSASGSVITGLIINNFEGDGIAIQSSNNSVTGCYIGTNATGTVASANGGNGITVTDGSENTIGGTTASERNVISGNVLAGIEITGSLATDNVIVGNYIGLNVAGTSALGNDGDGIQIDSGAGSNIIGSDDAGGGNVISGNAVGISLSESSSNMIHGNYIGTNAAGTGEIGNLSHGIQIGEDCHDNEIGDGEALAGNVIAFNGGHGISVESGSLRNTFSGNSIHSQDSGEGIELLGEAHGQVAPVLDSAQASGGQLSVTGHLTSAASTNYQIEFFRNHSGENSVQGEEYFGATTVTTDENGEGSFSVDLTADVIDGDELTATATVTDEEEAHATSEFAEALLITVDGAVLGSGGNGADANGCTLNATPLATDGVGSLVGVLFLGTLLLLLRWKVKRVG